MMTPPSNEPKFVILENRGTLAIDGPEARTFLQGVISNDIEKATSSQAIYAALLTAQGKYLHDFFIVEHEGVLLIDCEEARREDLFRRLSMYKLRAQATIFDRSDDYVTAALTGDDIGSICGLTGKRGQACTFHDGVAYIDPRHPDMGVRTILPCATAKQTLDHLKLEAGNQHDYDSLRFKLGLPDGSRDMVAEKSILLENGFDELHGVDWDKGCYIGQELTARTKHRGLIKKRLIPVTIDGPAPEPGAIISWGDKEAGELRSHIDGAGLALMRLEFLEKAAQTSEPFVAGDAKITPQKPDWADF